MQNLAVVYQETKKAYESYVDMHHGSKMGMYESSADKEYVPYVMPQEHGNHIKEKVLDIKETTKKTEAFGMYEIISEGEA